MKNDEIICLNITTKILFNNTVIYIEKENKKSIKVKYSFIHDENGSNVKFMDEANTLYLNSVELKKQLYKFRNEKNYED